MVDAEPLPGASEADHHFVGDVDDPVLGTQLSDTFEVAGWRRDHARTADHRLEHQCGDRRRPLHGDHVREVVERPLALLIRRGGAKFGAVEVRPEEMHNARGTRVRCPATVIAGEVHRRGRGAVIRAIRREQLRAPRVNASHPCGVLDCLGASVCEHHMVQPFRGDVGDHFRRLAAHVTRPDRSERAQAVGLLLDRGDHLRMLVPDVREHQLRAEIEVSPSGVIDEEAALASDERRDVSRSLRYPGVKDQLIQLRRVHDPKTNSRSPV